MDRTWSEPKSVIKAFITLYLGICLVFLQFLQIENVDTNVILGSVVAWWQNNLTTWEVCSYGINCLWYIFIKSNEYIYEKGLYNFFSFSSSKIKQLIIHVLSQTAGLPFLCCQFCHIEQLTIPEGDFAFTSLKQLVIWDCQNSRKAKSILRNIILFRSPGT